MKEKLIFILKRYVILLIFAYSIHKIFHFIFPMGEYLGLSWKDMINSIFHLNIKAYIYFSVFFTILLLFISHRVFKIKLFYALISAGLIGIYFTMFISPGYFLQPFIIKFSDFGDILSLVGIIMLSLAVVYLAPLANTPFRNPDYNTDENK